jgi:hypothetical protein
MRGKRVLAVAIILSALITAPYTIAYNLPTLESHVNVVSSPYVSMQVSQKVAQEIHEELSDLIYVQKFPELTVKATQLLNITDCGSYAIATASLLYERGYDPYVLYLRDNHDAEHVVVIYNGGLGWGSIGGLGWDNKPPVYSSIDELAKGISEDFYVDFIFKFSSEVYSGYYKIELKE